jgi:DNA-binding transcriptional LysR family regulator
MATFPPWNDRIRRRLKLRDLDLLLAVIQAGSMSKAATALNTSQPAISKAIFSLEHTLGVSLLDRTRRGVEPTPYGDALIRRGIAAFDELRQGVEDIAFLTDPAAGEIRAGGSEYVMSAIYSPVIQRLSTQYPRMSFEMVMGDLSMLYRELDARRIDVGVSRLYGPPPSDYSAEVLFDDPLVAVAGAKHPLTRRRSLTMADLVGEAWTLPPSSNDFGGFALSAFRAAGLAPPKVKVAATSYNLRGDFLATNRYLTITPRFWFLLRKERSLRMLPVDLRAPRHKVAIITVRNRSLSRASQFFIEGIRTITRPLAKLK